MRRDEKHMWVFVSVLRQSIEVETAICPIDADLGPPVEPINDNKLLFLPNNACCGEGEQDKTKTKQDDAHSILRGPHSKESSSLVW